MEQTPKIVLIGTAIYFFIGVMICDSLKNTRDGEEQGSSRWATIQEINRKYAAKEIVFPGVPKEMQNMILTSQARLGFDFHRHGKNGNTIIFGGPGTWKSRGYIIPNIMQMNCNFVITDPKGELAKNVGICSREWDIESLYSMCLSRKNLHVTIHLYISEMTWMCSILSTTFLLHRSRKTPRKWISTGMKWRKI